MSQGETLYNATASFGRFSSSLGTVFAIVCAVILSCIGAFLFFMPLKDPLAPSPHNDGMTNEKWSRSLGITLSICASCILCVSLIQYHLTHKYKGYAAFSGVSTLISPFT